MSRLSTYVALALLLVLPFNITTTTPAAAFFGYCFWWCPPPSAASLIDQRPNLRKLSATGRAFVIETIDALRKAGGSENDVKMLLDELNVYYSTQIRPDKGFSTALYVETTGRGHIIKVQTGIVEGATAFCMTNAALCAVTALTLMKAGSDAAKATGSYIAGKIRTYQSSMSSDADDLDAAEWRWDTRRLPKDWGSVAPYPEDPNGSNYCGRVSKYCHDYCTYLTLQLLMKFTPSGQGRGPDHHGHCLQRCKAFFGC